MKKKNLNWDVAQPLAERFDELVKSRYGAKGKWIGASGAIAMYLLASEDEQLKHDRLAMKAMTDGLSALLKQINANAVRGTSAEGVAGRIAGGRKKKAAKVSPKKKGRKPPRNQ